MEFENGNGHGRSLGYDGRRHRDDYDEYDYDSRRRRYHDYDRERDDASVSHLRYNDDYESRRDKRQRTRSRSPYRRGKESQPQNPRSRYDDARRNNADAKGLKAFVPASEQSVSERAVPGHARSGDHEAEMKGQSLQAQVSSVDESRVADRYVVVVSVAEDHADNYSDMTEPPKDEAALIEERRKRREALKAKLKGQSTPSLLVQALHINTPTGSSTPGLESESPSITGNTIKFCFSSALLTSLASPREVSAGPPSPLTEVSLAKDSEPSLEETTDEPSAADYDPTQDMQDDRLKQERQGNADVSATSYDETEPTKQDVLIPDESNGSKMVAADAFDMFAEEDDDDMFAEAPSKPRPAAESKAPASRELDIGMMDNWDDPEGYYNVRLGEVIDGRYQVQQNLGRGMFSGVVRVLDTKTDEIFAIKIIRNNETMRKAALKEIDILRTLREADKDDKKHLIRFERHFEHKGHICMVFENLSLNLREVLKKFGRDIGINLNAIRLYARQLFQGLDLMRKCDILHADLKPDNVLVNESRNVLKICDLGSASSTKDSDSEITPYLVSRFYRAPEIILGIPHDFAIDIWSVGCTLFELHTGKILFTGRTNNQMLRAMQECRGKFPPRMIKRGALSPSHFVEIGNGSYRFQSLEEDRISGRVLVKPMDFLKPTRDLRTRIVGKGAGNGGEDMKDLLSFVDLLEGCLHLNPEKRIKPSEALRHPFVRGLRG